MKKKIMAVLLACALAAGTAAGSAGPVMAWTVQGSEVAEGFEGLDNNGTISITRYVGNGTEVTVPGSINGKKVMSIYPSAFAGSNVKSVVIQGVNVIGRGAFSSCSELESVNILEGTFTIEEFAFASCGKLESVSIPDSVTRIGKNAFSGTPWLAEQLEKGDGLAVADHKVIGAKEDLSGDLVIPEGADVIGEAVFKGRVGLESVSIPESMTRIGIEAFCDCSGLKSVSIPKSVTNIGDKAFSGCSGLESVSIPEGVKVIGWNVFSGCSGLKSVSIPEGVELISSGAFSRCSGLKSMSIPGSVIGILNNAFSGCVGLESVSISEGLQSIDAGVFSGCGNLKSVNIPASMTRIGTYAFGECGNLKDVYYAGSPEQWEKIAIESENDILLSANIHYNSVSAEDPGPENPGDSGTEKPGNPGQGSDTSTLSVQKFVQSITANDNMIKTYGAKAFSLGAKSSGGTTLSYEVSDPKVATVDVSGKVTVKGCGMTNITITAAETEKYKKAQKTVRLTVKPKKAALSSVKSKKKKTAEVKWKRNKEASGYIIQCATDKKFKKNKAQAEVSKNKTLLKTMKNLKGGKRYYVRVCAYAKSGNRKIQGDWSKAKTVKVKK